MLIAHAASTCDVCLDGYREDCSYHSIPCGHVFCLPCLVSTSPAKCPLCRHEFTPLGVRKVHLTLPSERDLAARRLELKLVQSSPEMTLAESLLLFDEVQEWLEGEAQDEFLVLRAFAAVMCGFHETKDKLLQTEARAEKNEAALLRSLDEARNAITVRNVDYKAKYQAAKAELATLRSECADLRTKAEQAQKYNSDVQAYYAQTQPLVQSQSDSDAQPRRMSNPLPAPPRPIDIPLLKIFEALPSSQSQAGKGIVKELPTTHDPDHDVDPMTSAFVPTLSSSITTRNSSSKEDGRSEVTTLVFKPPRRMPVWDSPNTSYARIDAHRRMPPSTRSDSSSRPASYANADDLMEYSRTDELAKTDIQYKPYSYDPVHPERTHHANPVSRPTSYVEESSQANAKAAPLSRETGIGQYPSRQSRAPISENNDMPERNLYPIATALTQPVTYASSPRVASQVLRETPTAPYTMLPASRPREREFTNRGDAIRGFNLRRASSPVVMLSDTDTRTRPNDLSTLLSRRPDRRQDEVAGLPYSRGMSGDDVTVSTDGGRQRRRSPSPNGPRDLEIRARRPQINAQRPIQNEGVTSPERRVVEFPPSSRHIDEEHLHPNANRVNHNQHATLSHTHSRSLATHIHQDMARPLSPVPIRERAHSHSHSYPAPAFPLNRRHADYVSPINRRLTIDLSIAGPGTAFHTMDANRPRAMPVAEV